MVICDNGIINACMEHSWKDLKGQDLFVELQKEKIWSNIKIHAIEGKHQIDETLFDYPLTKDNKRRIQVIFRGYGYNMKLLETNICAYSIEW